MSVLSALRTLPARRAFVSPCTNIRGVVLPTTRGIASLSRTPLSRARFNFSGHSPLAPLGLKNATCISFRTAFISSSSSSSTPLAIKIPNGVNGNSKEKNKTPTRGVASSVSGRPASQSFEHAATNIREEVGHSAADLAEAIASANVTAEAAGLGKQRTFLGITTNFASQVPRPILSFGLAGTLPYLVTSAVSIGLARKAGLVASSQLYMDPGLALTIFDRALNLQVTYGAVILSFLGALHWGMEFSGYGGHKGYARLALGAAPVLLAWFTLSIAPLNALVTQWFGFTLMWWADSKATNSGWTPKWYSQYRFYISLLVGVCIIATLAATSHWGPVAGHGFLSHDLDVLRAERRKTLPEEVGVVAGPIEAVPAGEEADHFVRIRRKNTSKEEEKNEDQTKPEEVIQLA